MGDTEEIPQRVNPEKRPCVDGQAQPHSPTSVAAVVSKVLDDDNLLREIIVRVGFPTTLVRAALVCKRWLCHISDRKFLGRFRKLNPPRLLGFYIESRPVSSQPDTPLFVPMLPQPPELTAVVRRMGSHNFGAHKQLRIMDCRNGSVFTRRLEGGALAHVVYRMLRPETGVYIVPPLPPAQDPSRQVLGEILSKEKEGVLSYLYVLAEWISGTSNIEVCVYMLQDGVWCMHTLATEEILNKLSLTKATLVGNKIYVADFFCDNIIVLDLTTSSSSRILLPRGVKYHLCSTALSPADDASGVYLTHLWVNEFKLHIWLHKGDDWLLVHTICLHEMLNRLMMLDHTLGDEDTGFFYLRQVGDNAEFVFLNMCGHIFYLDVTSRTLLKVHETEREENDGHFSDVYPFMMIWPPTFPAPKDDPARNAM